MKWLRILQSRPVCPLSGGDMVRQHYCVDPHLSVDGCNSPPTKLRFQRLPNGVDLPLPAPARAGDAGLDLAAARDLVVPAGGMQPVPTGFAVAIPPGHFGMVVPRSGMVRKNGITVANSPGVIDAGYRGEIIVLLLNRGEVDFTVRRGERIAQMIVQAFSFFERAEVDELDATDRGDAGFGSSGV